MDEVIYLSHPAPVHMADEWFKIASGAHFWIRRRFDVLRKLAKNIPIRGQKMGEIGCGYGLVQKQVEEHYGIKVDGFDLNADALRDSVARNHSRFCYDVFECNPRLAAQYDLLALFDVLEHIEQEKPFLEAVLYHLKPGGHLLINVPALMTFYSAYDKVVGHQRRYSMPSLHAACTEVGLKRVVVTYWGLPLVPFLWLRNLRVSRQKDPQRVIQVGYKPPNQLANQFLNAWCRLELVPQRLLGTSLMAIYRKEENH
jgi:SAM-dependent methyltransferase